MTEEQAFRSVWAVIGFSAKSEQNTVVINMYPADDENYIKSRIRMQQTAIIHPAYKHNSKCPHILQILCVAVNCIYALKTYLLEQRL